MVCQYCSIYGNSSVGTNSQNLKGTCKNQLCYPCEMLVTTRLLCHLSEKKESRSISKSFCEKHKKLNIPILIKRKVEVTSKETQAQNTKVIAL